MTAAVVAVHDRGDHLAVELERDGTVHVVELIWMWLRDNADDPGSLDPHAGQRVVDTFSLDPDDRPTAVERSADGAVVCSWADGSTTSVSAERLAEAIPAMTHRQHWDASRPPTYEVGHGPTVLVDDAACSRWLEGLVRLGFGVLDDLEPTRQGARALAERLGYARATVFGDVWELAPEVADHADSAYGTTALKVHTDGTYNQDAPGYQAFLCVDRAGDGGAQVLVDGFAAVERLEQRRADLVEVLSAWPVTGHYREPGVDLRATRPPLRRGADGRLEQLSVNNYDRGPTLLPPDEMREFYRAWTALDAELSDPSQWLELDPVPGRALVIDNWRVCHGRRAFTGSRRFFGFYLNHEDVDSTRRVLSTSPVHSKPE